MVHGFPNNVGVDNLLGKVDYNLNQRNSISGMYFFGNNSGTVEDFPELQSQWRSKIHTRAQVVGGNWVWTPGAPLGERSSGRLQPSLPAHLARRSEYPGIGLRSRTQASAVRSPEACRALDFAGAFVPGLGAFKWPKFQGPDTITQFIDHVSYTAGKHSLKFGGELHRTAMSAVALSATPEAASRSWVELPIGARSRITAAWRISSPAIPSRPRSKLATRTLQIHNWAYAAFFQDDWRVTKNLTVNFGVRYEFNSRHQGSPQSAGQLRSRIRHRIDSGGTTGVSGPYNPDHKNFAPRLGFAWDVTGKGQHGATRRRRPDV